ncbi:hypothetical protein D3C80_1699700 [compost metagenome]
MPNMRRGNIRDLPDRTRNEDPGVHSDRGMADAGRDGGRLQRAQVREYRCAGRENREHPLRKRLADRASLPDGTGTDLENPRGRG